MFGYCPRLIHYFTWKSWSSGGLEVQEADLGPDCFRFEPTSCQDCHNDKWFTFFIWSEFCLLETYGILILRPGLRSPSLSKWDFNSHPYPWLLHPHPHSLTASPFLPSSPFSLSSSPSACNLNSVVHWTNRSLGVLFFIPAIFLWGKGE